VFVSHTCHVEAEACSVSDVSHSSHVEGSLAEVRLPVRSKDSSSANLVADSPLNGEDEVMLVPGPDGVRSGIKEPPLFVVKWVVVLESQLVLLLTDVFVVGNGSAATLSGLDLELLLVCNWVLGVHEVHLINVPLLVHTVVASPPDQVLVINVPVSSDINTLLAVVLDVLALAIVPNDALVNLLLE